MPNFADIEDDIKQALQDELPYLGTVETFAGELNSAVSGRPIKYPAVVIVLTNEYFTQVDAKQYQREAEFALLITATSLRTPEAVRTADYGAYRVVEDVLQVLTNKNVSNRVTNIQPIDTKIAAETNSTRVVYVVRFRAIYDSEFNWAS